MLDGNFASPLTTACWVSADAIVKEVSAGWSSVDAEQARNRLAVALPWLALTLPLDPGLFSHKDQRENDVRPSGEQY
jgi:hypothetical protein